MVSFSRWQKLMAKSTAYEVPCTSLLAFLPAVHVLEQLAHVVGSHADVAQDLLPAGPGEIGAVGLEDQLGRERGVEPLLLEQLPAFLLCVAAPEALQRVVVMLGPAVLVWVPVAGPEHGARVAGLARLQGAGNHRHQVRPPTRQLLRRLF